MSHNGHNGNSDQYLKTLSQGLGWFSIGLGLAELLAPRQVSGWIGAPVQGNLLRALGLRELTNGLGILMRPKPTGWMFSRVAGDAMDLALLGAAIVSPRSQRAKVIAAAAAVAGVTALDLLAAQKLRKRSEPLRRGIQVRKVITINAPSSELYRRWHDLSQLPGILSHIESVHVLNEKRSHWVARGPAGTQIEWDAEITEDVPDTVIAWRSLEGADIPNKGAVRFQPARGNRGSIMRVELEYDPPAGKLGSLVGKLFGQAPEKQVIVDLLRFKQLVETGEIARTEGQSAGRRRSTSRKYDDFVRK